MANYYLLLFGWFPGKCYIAAIFYHILLSWASVKLFLHPKQTNGATYPKFSKQTQEKQHFKGHSKVMTESSLPHLAPIKRDLGTFLGAKGKDTTKIPEAGFFP